MHSDMPETLWRTWISGGTDVDTATTAERTDVPHSTMTLPLTYYKRVNCEHLDSIARQGLLATPEGVVFHGYSKGTKFATRDVFLLAVWLGAKPSVGESMQPEDGKVYVNLTIRVTEEFRYKHLRDIHAVLRGDDNTNGDTALAFASIPPDWIYLVISEDVVQAVKKQYASAKLVAGEHTLKALYQNLKLIINALKEVGNKETD